MLTYKVEEDSDAMRLDQFLTKLDPEMSRSYWQQTITHGLVTINGEPAGSASKKLKAGDKIVISDIVSNKVAIDIPIIYEDKDVIVINKPAGVLTHPARLFKDEFTLVDLARKHADKNAEDIDSERFGVVHRLDRATSGVLIMSKHSAAKAHLQKQFADRKAQKTYIAVVDGIIEEDLYDIQWPLERKPSTPQFWRVGVNGKAAQTSVKVLHRHEKTTTVELRPSTGRTHQLRVHMSHLKHPIVGDPVYGKEGKQLMLHAYKLELTLPSGQHKAFVAEPPAYMAKYVV